MRASLKLSRKQSVESLVDFQNTKHAVVYCSAAMEMQAFLAPASSLKYSSGVNQKHRQCLRVEEAVDDAWDQ